MIGSDRVIIENLNARLPRTFGILKGDKLIGQRLIMMYTIEAAVLLLVWKVQYRPAACGASSSRRTRVPPVATHCSGGLSRSKTIARTRFRHRQTRCCSGRRRSMGKSR